MPDILPFPMILRLAVDSNGSRLNCNLGPQIPKRFIGREEAGRRLLAVILTLPSRSGRRHRGAVGPSR